MGDFTSRSDGADPGLKVLIEPPTSDFLYEYSYDRISAFRFPVGSTVSPNPKKEPYISRSRVKSGCCAAVLRKREALTFIKSLCLHY